MDWLMDDVMMRLTAKKCEDGKPQAEQERSALEVVVRQTQLRKTGAGGKGKLTGVQGHE